MLVKLVWEQSGDELIFKATFPELIEYYADCINKDQRNTFRCSGTTVNPKLIQSLTNNLLIISKVVNKLPIRISNWEDDILDQDYLNKLHTEWVKTGIEFPKIPLLLRNMGELDIPYREINTNIHGIEAMWNYEFVNYSQDPYQIENIFGSSIINFDTANLMLGFDNLGRSTWDKWTCWDKTVDDCDTNNYKKLGGKISLSLNRPTVGTAPKEYTDWCSQNNITPVGKGIPLGNIIDLESKLTSIRHILSKNINEQNDNFIIEICSK
jgi:hypothetical protein